MRCTMPKELKLFSGKANPTLAKDICEYLGIPLGAATLSSFSRPGVSLVS